MELHLCEQGHIQGVKSLSKDSKFNWFNYLLEEKRRPRKQNKGKGIGIGHWYLKKTIEVKYHSKPNGRLGKRFC